MTTIRTGLLATMLLALAIPAAAQTNPCADPLPTVVKLNPTKLVARLTEHATTLPDGSPLVTEYVVGHFVQGTTQAGTPVQTATVPKTAWSLIAGTPDCYQATLGSVPVSVGSTVYVSELKARRVPADGSPAEESSWSFPSNPFGRTAAPQAPPVVVVR